MSRVAAQPFAGTYRAQPTVSTIAFAVRHSETFWFRGTIPDVAATLRADDEGTVLEGLAQVESISVLEPAPMRASLLGPGFFDAERYPELSFRSTEMRFSEGDRLELDGELTMRGTTRPVLATGEYGAPLQATFGEIAGLRLHADVDRREWGFDWQLELPGGGLAVGWEVGLDIDLMLIAGDPDDDG
jgi:polyisoprenoid-binding protein YceI